MKRLLVSLLALGVLLSAASACEVIGSNVAATVDGKDITIDQVREVAKAEGVKPSASATTTKTLDSAGAQKSLSLWIQIIGSERALAKLGKSPSSSDRSSASQSTSSIKGVSARTKAELTSGIASANSLLTNLATDANPVFRQLVKKAFAGIPASERKLLCSQAIYGPATAADQVQQLLDAGTAIDDPTAFSSLSYGPPTSEKQLCVSKSGLPAEIADAYFAAPAGKVESSTFTTQGSDGSPQTVTLFYKITGTTKLTASSDEVVQEVQTQLKSNPDVLLDPVFKKLAIHVDPRFGSGFSLTKGVIPPVSPVVPTTKPSKLKAKPPVSAPADSAPTATSTPSG